MSIAPLVCGRRPRAALTRLVARATVAFLLMYVSNSLSHTFQNSNPSLQLDSKNSKKVISYSLYGSDPRYIDGAVENAKLIKLVYSGWLMRVYHDASVPVTVVQRLHGLGVEMVNMSGTLLNGMTWRFLVASDPTIDFWCSRDIDSRLSLREKVCVDQWLETTRDFHIIRDHPSHTQVIPGGTWCGRKNAIPEMESVLRQNSVAHEYGADQQFLKQCVWPRVKKSALQHVSFGCKRFKDSRPIPVKRSGLEHVGAVFIDGQLRHIDQELLLVALQRGRECT